ncbi:MAG: PD-(D/E)XK nuclease family protein [Deltaproteobacteria bacterium]|nr:PD-(D/E)XK nuclease family protein [Deltaproteobacteria bacterium]
MSLENLKPVNREELAGQLHLSYSQLNAYLICPAKYAHQYVWGTPMETKPAALVLGSAIHKAAEAYYLKLKETGEVLALEQVVSVFEEVLRHEMESSGVEWSFKNGNSFEALRKQGAELLRLFHAEVSPQQIMAVEFPFIVSVPDLSQPGEKLPVKLAGFLDLIESDGETYIVGELKTSGQRFTSLRLDYDLQATVYSYAMTRMRLAPSPESCVIRYDVLLKLKQPAFEKYFVVRNEADHRHLVQLINEVLRAIDQRIFYRNTGWQCGDCQFKKTCYLN